MDEEIRCGTDILDKPILWRLLHIPKSSFIESSRATSAVIFLNEEKSMIGFPSGRLAWHNCCTGLTFFWFIVNRSSIDGVAGSAFKNFPAPFEHSKDSISNSFRLTQPAKSAKAKFRILDRLIPVRVGKWRRGTRTFRPDDIHSSCAEGGHLMLSFRNLTNFLNIGNNHENLFVANSSLLTW